MSPMDFKPLPPASDSPAKEWDFERESTAVWVLKGVLKGLWWGGLGLGALVLLFTEPVGFAVVALLTAILWKLYKSDD